MAATTNFGGLPEAYSSFHNIIGIIFNNWTALKLAVEHGTGGPPKNTMRKLMAMIEAVSDCFNSGVMLGKVEPEWMEVSDVLIEMMDTEFCTVLEDDSHDEVALHLCQLYEIFCSGDAEALNSALSVLPNQSPIVTSDVPMPKTSQHPQTEFTISDREEENTSDEAGWTLVKKK